MKFWAPAVLWASFIFFMSSRPNLSAGTFPFSDKIAHFVVYLIFGFFVARFVAGDREILSRKRFFLSLLIIVVYALSDEFHQTFVPGRTAELGDLLSDFAGGVCGIFIYGYKFSSKKRD